MSNEHKTPPVILITGFESMLSRRLCRTLLENRPQAVVQLLVEPDDALAAHDFSGALPASLAPRCEILEGSARAMNLGLSSDDYRRLTVQLVEIHHTAECAARQKGRTDLFRANVDATRELLELASACAGLKRFCHWSTTRVAGDRQGVVMEDELEAGQRFSDDYERSKYEAEKLVRRWARRIPVTVFRPTLLGGDSTDGTLDPAGPAFRLFEMLISGGRDSLALSSTASDAPFNLVPIDFVVRTADQIARHKAAVGRTFHLVDPNPLSVRRLYTLVARKAHRQPPKRLLPPQLVEWLPKVPLLSRLQPHLPTPLSVFALHNVFFNSQNTADLLRDTDVHCPPLHAYIDLVVRHVREVIDQRRPAAEEEISDPLA